MVGKLGSADKRIDVGENPIDSSERLRASGEFKKELVDLMGGVGKKVEKARDTKDAVESPEVDEAQAEEFLAHYRESTPAEDIPSEDLSNLAEWGAQELEDYNANLMADISARGLGSPDQLSI